MDKTKLEMLESENAVSFRKKQEILGLPNHLMAETLGVTVSYISQLRLGQKKMSKPLSKLLDKIIEGKENK